MQCRICPHLCSEEMKITSEVFVMCTFLLKYFRCVTFSYVLKSVLYLDYSNSHIQVLNLETVDLP